jgi:hypothetical protein
MQNNVPKNCDIKIKCLSLYFNKVIHPQLEKGLLSETTGKWGV